MAKKPSHRISTIKEPKQARSEDLVKAVLEAAVQVLTEEGAPRFTTARVAERAGVSVGSLYQYFPNKASILFRLQLEEWRASARIFTNVLNGLGSPEDRLRRLIRDFLRSECEEAAIRRALADSAPLYRDAPEARAAREETDRMFDAFIEQLLPDIPEPERDLAGEMIASTLSSVGKDLSRSARSEQEIDRFGSAMADMLCGYVRDVRKNHTVPKSPKPVD